MDEAAVTLAMLLLLEYGSCLGVEIRGGNETLLFPRSGLMCKSAFTGDLPLKHRVVLVWRR
jgi:hypothetical protein